MKFKSPILIMIPISVFVLVANFSTVATKINPVLIVQGPFFGRKKLHKSPYFEGKKIHMSPYFRQ